MTDEPPERHSRSLAFGALLRQLRRAAGMSQEELAERARLSVESISALERGRRRAPYRQTVAMLADALRATPADRDELIAAARVAKSLPLQAVRYDSANPALPAAIKLVGRDDALRDLEALCDKNRLVTITGPGGIGKTSVARELARRVASSAGITNAFVELAPLDHPSLVASTLATSIGLTGGEPRNTLDAIVAYIAGTPIVVTLDNCEHLLDEIRAVVTKVLAGCANARIIVTSREVLELEGERVFRLPPLTYPQPGRAIVLAAAGDVRTSFSAIELFVDRATSHDSTFAPYAPSVFNDIAAICRQLDGVPLALELAAVQTRAIGIEQLRVELQRIVAVTSRKHAKTLPRQQTLHALTDWSYQLLTASEQAVFRRLAIFVGGWTIDAAQAVCADAEFAADDVLSAVFGLVRKSLVVSNFETGRYRYLESTRSYALNVFAGDELQRTSKSFIAWAAAFARATAERFWRMSRRAWQVSALPEIDNVRLALSLALENGEIELAGQIAGSTAKIWLDTGFRVEGRRWIEAVLQSPAALDRVTRGRAYTGLAVLESGKGIVTASSTAIELLEPVGNAPDIAQACCQRAIGLWQTGDNTGAMDALDEAQRYERRFTGSVTRISAEFHDLRAQILLAQGLLVEARAELDIAYELLQLFGDEEGLARNRGNLAELEFARGDSRRAFDLVQEAASAFERMELTPPLATTYVNAAAYSLDLAMIEAARSYARNALAIARRTQNTLIFVIAAQHFATILVVDGHLRQAALFAGFVDSWFETAGYQRERNEQRLYDRLMESLRLTLRAPELAALLDEGARLNEEWIAASAMRSQQIAGDESPLY